MTGRVGSEAFVTSTGRLVRISGPYEEQQRAKPGDEKFYGWVSLDGRGLAAAEVAEVDAEICRLSGASDGGNDAR